MNHNTRIRAFALLLSLTMVACGQGEVDLIAHEGADVGRDVSSAEDAGGPGRGLDAAASADLSSSADVALDAPDVAAPDTSVPCDDPARWRCDGDARVSCVDQLEVREVCERGCLPSPSAQGDAQCIFADPAWSCDRSEYQGQQYWTCDASASELHYCDASGGVVVRCDEGCLYGPLATDDSCIVPGGTVIPMPRLTFNISGNLFSEADVRPPVEQGLRYLLDRVAQHVAVPAAATLPDITINYSPSSNSYCSGYAHFTSTDIACPRGYPITGASQNYVVNITIHELGHIVAAHLIATANYRDLCENEGIATWMAGRYWATTNGAQVDSLRTAARDAIAQGRASARMTNCVSASDAWYKVYGSFFEYLEQFPGAIRDVSAGTTDSAAYTSGWAAWLTP